MIDFNFFKNKNGYLPNWIVGSVASIFPLKPEY